MEVWDDSFDPNDFLRLRAFVHSTIHEDGGVQLEDAHKCTEEELEGEKSKFYQISDANKPDYELLKPKFMCFDLSKVKLFGNYNSPSYSVLDIHIQIKEEYCTNKNDSTTRDKYQTEDIIEAL